MSMKKQTIGTAAQKILTGGAVIYTLFVLLLAFLQGQAVASGSLRFLLLFSLCFSCANYIQIHTKISGFLKFIIHFLLTVGGLFLFVILPTPNEGSSSSRYFVVLCFFTVLYLLVYGSIVFFRSRWKKEIRQEEAYAPQFAAKDNTVHTEKRGQHR